MMKKFGLLVLALVSLNLLCGSCLGQSAEARVKYNFNSGWRVLVGDPHGAELPEFDDSAWKQVTTPYAWNEDSAFRVSIHDLPTGVAWYRKHFRLPASSAGQKIFIEFEGIRQAGEVYLNGKFIGRHEDGVMAFGFDISDAVKPAPAENLIAVRTDNRWDYKEKATGASYHWNNTNFYSNSGGISKSVWLHVTGKLYQTLPLYSQLGTTGVYVWASGFDIPGRRARVTVESEVRNEESAPAAVGYQVEIKDMAGRIVSRFDGGTTTLAAGETRTLSASALVHDLNFWSWGYGYLYTVTTKLVVGHRVVDAVNTRTGFRKTEFANGMVKLNDRVIDFHGYAQRTTNEWPAVGLSVPPWMSDFSNRLMVDGNANLVRWMHVTPWKQDVESSDRVGLIQSMPAGDAEGDSKGRQWEQRVELMRDAILYNRNNPSILFYECGNKGISEEHMAEMKKVRDQYDPHGGRAIGAREMLSSKVAEYGGEMLYVDKSATKPVWMHEYSRDEGARLFWDEDSPPFHKDSPYYNRNMDSQAIENVRRWYDYYLARPGTGKRVNSGGAKIIFSDSNTHYRGDNNYRRSGEVDAMRLPKDSYFADQVMWNGWVDVEHPGIHIIGHWNYAPGTVKPVYVVSTAQRVELKLNGRSLGNGVASSGFLFTFENVHFVPGTLEAIGYDAQGRRVIAAVLRTSGKPAALRLTLHTGPGGLRADGADMALVDVEVVDREGKRCPTALDPVHFTLSGAAEWRGGIAQGSAVPAPINTAVVENKGMSPTFSTPFLHYDNYILSKTLPVEDGVNRVILRSLPTAGKITLRAEADGLKPAEIELASVPVTVQDGLSTTMPDAKLPSNLKRGPTPLGASFHPSRYSIAVATLLAGSNAADAALSQDDDDYTTWTSDETLDHAWIEYDFAKPEKPSQIDLKLADFRMLRYPLRVTLDGKTVWEGVTPINYGYCTLPLKPASGTHLRIALTGPPMREIDPIVELAASSSGRTHTWPPIKPVLAVSETEIYKAAP
ncbi:MAG: sugar-binding domain-containing protein [Terracidiphilus sp.]|jgi:hypothetical protein